MKVLLLAGLYQDGELQREAKLKSFTGEVEQQISHILMLSDVTPVKVTKLICCFVDSVGVVPMTSTLADQLCVADRQLLILKLAQSIEGDQVWLHPNCINCHEPFDLGYQRSLLPVTTVDENILIDCFQNGINVNLGSQSLRFRPPNGGDQVVISSLSNDEALSRLIERIAYKEDSVKLPAPGSLTLEQINAISQALDEVTPQLADELVTQCPNCQFKQTVVLDPYHMKGLGEDYLLQDIHYLAMHYHWSEAEIMSLSRQRRRKYIQLIGESGGYHE